MLHLLAAQAKAIGSSSSCPKADTQARLRHLLSCQPPGWVLLWATPGTTPLGSTPPEEASATPVSPFSMIDPGLSHAAARHLLPLLTHMVSMHLSHTPEAILALWSRLCCINLHRMHQTLMLTHTEQGLPAEAPLSSNGALRGLRAWTTSKARQPSR